MGAAHRDPGTTRPQGGGGSLHHTGVRRYRAPQTTRLLYMVGIVGTEHHRPPDYFTVHGRYSGYRAPQTT